MPRHIAILLIMTLQIQMEMMNKLILMMDDSEDILITTCRILIVEITSIIIERIKPLRIENYVERLIAGQTATQFQEHFHVTPDIFEIVLKISAPQLISINKFKPTTKLMNPRKQLLAALWLLAAPDSYRSVAERFNMGKSSLHHSFVNVVKVIITKSSNIIKWPTGKEENVAKKFKKIAGIPGVIGAIDGTYIPIRAPEEYPERYINRKCYHAITLQAVCDADLQFTDAFAGYPSSVSDRRIFNNSDVYKNVLNGKIKIPEGFFILGDKAYPVLNWCIPPFIDRGRLSDREKNFNVAVAKTRQCIERAFALLKGRFRRLKYIDMSMTYFIPYVILASCVLHNLCLLKGKDKDTIEKYISEGMPSADGDNRVDNAVPIGDRETEGKLLRDRIMLGL